MRQDDEHDLPQASLHEQDSRSAIRPALELNAEDYLSDLAEFDLTEAEKVALLQTLWDIMKAFVEMGFDVSRTDICERIFAESDPDKKHSADNVKSSFTKATETNSHRKQKETST